MRKETERHHLTNSMSPSYKTTTTQKFSLTDPIVNVEKGTDPTEEWFNIHRKFFKFFLVLSNTEWPLRAPWKIINLNLNS